jgi:hypothetical protein
VRIFVALVEAHTFEAAARLDEAQGLPYLGVWRLPEPFGGIVHVFTEYTEEQLRDCDWTRVEVGA